MSHLLAGAFDATAAVANDALYESLATSSDGADPVVCGVGARLSLVHDPPLCVPSSFHTYLVAVGSVVPGSPAARAGVASGDLVAAVDGTRLDYGRRVYLPAEVAGMVRGPRGTTVEVTLQRAGRDWSVRLTREEPVGEGAAMPGGRRGGRR